MNLLFWADGFWPRIGGTETQGLQFVEELQKRGHRCLVFAQKDHPAMKGDETYRGIFIRRFDFNAMIKNRELKIFPLLSKVISDFKPDIVYLNTLGNGSALAFLLCRNLLQVPVIATVHAPYYGDTIPLLVEQICSKIDHICCASAWGAREMQKLLPAKKLRQINYGISTPATLPSPLPFSPPTILLLGRLSSEKGFEVAIEAFSLLQTDAKLLIAGEGDERPFLEHLANKLGLRNSVEFTGGADRSGEEVFSIINRATFVVMPSHFEAFGLVALESMRMGRPVIASDVGGLPEIVSHRETGLLVPPNQPKAFAEAMKELLEDPEKTVQMGRRAREWAISHYSLQDNVDQYLDLFKGMQCNH